MQRSRVRSSRRPPTFLSNSASSESVDASSKGSCARLCLPRAVRAFLLSGCPTVSSPRRTIANRRVLDHWLPIGRSGRTEERHDTGAQRQEGSHVAALHPFTREPASKRLMLCSRVELPKRPQLEAFVRGIRAEKKADEAADRDTRPDKAHRTAKHYSSTGAE